MNEAALLTADEVAKFFRVSKTTVYRWVGQRRIPFYKIGNELRFSEKDIVRFLESARIEYQPFIKEAVYQPPRDIQAKKKQGYLKIEEVAQLFGAPVQRVSQMIQSGMIGCIRTGGRLLFYKPDMESFLAEQMKKPINERFYLNKNKSHPNK